MPPFAQIGIPVFTILLVQISDYIHKLRSQNRGRGLIKANIGGGGSDQV